MNSPVDKVDKVVKFVVARAAENPHIQRVVLFGSRARGDATPRSDYDFAVDAATLSHAEWSRWSLDTTEAAPTLCALDLVPTSGAISDELRRAIQTEGVTVYERGTDPPGD